MNAALNSMVYDTVLLNMLYLVIVYSFFVNIILEMLVGILLEKKFFVHVGLV